MRIQKFLQGGLSLPAFLDYRPVVIANNDAAYETEDAEEPTKSNKSDLTDKDLVTMIKDKVDGLPNDIDYITRSLLNFYINDSLLVNKNTSSIASRYIAILGQLQKAKFSKELFSDAKKHLENNGGINEIAIDENGFLFCTNEDGTDFKRLTLDLLKLTKGYQPLTNGQLLQFRSYRPDLVGRDDVTDVISHGIGMKTVVDFLNSAINKLGTDSMQQEGYTKTQARQITDGIEYLQEAMMTLHDDTIANGMSLDGIYKSGILTKDLTRQVGAALNYLVTIMPRNMRTLLEIKAEESGLNQDGQGILNVLTQLLASQTGITRDFTISAFSSADETTSSKKGSKSSNGDNVELSSAALLAAGLTANTNFRIVNGTTAGLNVPAGYITVMKDKNNALGTATLEQVMQSEAAGLLNSSYITLGGLRIMSTLLDRVVVDSNKMYLMYLPYDKNAASLQGGLKTPDFNMLEKLETVMNDLKTRNIDILKKNKTPQEIEAINKELLSKQLPAMFDEAGNLRVTDYMPFVAFNGWAPDLAFQALDDLEINALEVTDQNVLESIQRSINKGVSNKADRITFDTKGMNRDHVYQGTVFIAADPTAMNNILTTGGIRLTPQQAIDLSDREHSAQRMLVFGYLDGTKAF